MTEDVHRIGGGSGVLLLGDSLVAGEGAEGDFGWAQRLRRDLDADMVAICGITSGGLLERLPPPAYGTVIVQIGTNDARFRHQRNATETTPAQLRDNLAALCRHFSAPGRAVDFHFVDTVFVDEARSVLFKPDRSYFSTDLEIVSQELAAFCAAQGHGFVSLRHIAARPERLCDGLHPDDATHREIYETVRRATGGG